ncbi:TRAP transporter substrate-binding protein [Desulfobacula sp.]|uniref:TRAP transporter substrate-binding protein n=1 Tax=Desulfobacula sp. TaxID=2593537 RepID=UPI0026018FBA|nr:TRAP transporter substrate-binding protein [Desulfobacula sp.]
MKRILLTICMQFVMIIAVSFICSTWNAEAKTVTLRYSNMFPPVHPITKLGKDWCKEVEKRTNGAVKVHYFPGNSLTRPTEAFDGVIKGVVDVALSFCSYSGGRFPLTEVIDLPLGYKSSMQATGMANAYFQKFMPKELADVELMYFHTSPPHRLFTKKPVRNLDDLKGLKIRTTGTSAKVVEALGGVPVSMPMSDAYDALKRGVVNGYIGPFEAVKGFKLIDVVDYATIFKSAYVNVAYVVMNKNKWESFSPETRKSIQEINKEFMARQWKLWDQLDAGAIEAFTKAKKEIINLSDVENDKWTARLAPILDTYVKEKSAQGLPGQEVLQFCKAYLKSGN